MKKKVTLTPEDQKKLERFSTTSVHSARLVIREAISSYIYIFDELLKYYLTIGTMEKRPNISILPGSKIEN